jgi:hypothetical protein
MRNKLSVESYKSVDGSSLTTTRCDQMVLVYDMLEELGTKVMTYLDLQEEAQRRRLFGSTKAKSAIRTFFPLLKKLDFVEYEGSFAANMCFTELGTQFVLACRALKNVTDSTPNKDEVIARLNSIKRNAQAKGLVNMYNDPEWKSHNIWIVLKLFKVFKILHWNEFLFTLHYLEKGKTIEDAIEEIKINKIKIDNIEFVNDDNLPLQNTCYSYLRSFLEEIGIISKISTYESKLLDSSELLYSQINI